MCVCVCVCVCVCWLHCVSWMNVFVVSELICNIQSLSFFGNLGRSWESAPHFWCLYSIDNVHSIAFLLWKCSREREQNISILTILHLPFLISNMMLLILLFAIKLLVPIFLSKSFSETIHLALKMDWFRKA